MPNIDKTMTIDTDSRTVGRWIEVSREEGGPMMALHVTLNYSKVSDADLFRKAAASDIITAQGRIRRNWSDYDAGDCVSFDVSKSQASKRLSDEERVRRAAAGIFGEPDIEIDDPRVVAMLEAANKAHSNA